MKAVDFTHTVSGYNNKESPSSLLLSTSSVHSVLLSKYLPSLLIKQQQGKMQPCKLMTLTNTRIHRELLFQALPAEKARKKIKIKACVVIYERGSSPRIHLKAIHKARNWIIYGWQLEPGQASPRRGDRGQWIGISAHKWSAEPPQKVCEQELLFIGTRDGDLSNSHHLGKSGCVSGRPCEAFEENHFLTGFKFRAQ